MKVHPFDECAKAAIKWTDQGATIFQQYNCGKCGTKQTMDEPNRFFNLGKCEECGHITDIKRDGCNYMVSFTT